VNIEGSSLMLSIRGRQWGLTLIEIMVALLIGAFLLAGVIQIFIVNKQTYRVQENLSRMQENGRFAMDYLSRYVRLAGYVANEPLVEFQDETGSDKTAIIRRTFSPPSGPASGPTSGLIYGENNTGLSNISDSVTVRFKADPDDYNPMTDCLGNKVGKNAIVTNLFFLELDNNQPTLYCDPEHGAGQDPAKNPSKQPVIDGVENMQIRYCEGLGKCKTFDKDGKCIELDIVEKVGCVTANKVTDWNNIQSVKISLLMKSINNGLVSQPQPYQWDADGDGKDDDPPPTPTDRHLRRVFTSTISLRNHD